MADPVTGGNNNLGTHTVYAQWHDKAGNWSQSSSDSIILTSSQADLSYSQIVRNDYPVSYWRLGELNGTTAYDRINVNNGTYKNLPSLGAKGLIPTDQINNAVSFDGVKNQVKIATTSASINPINAVSLEAWIKPAAIPTAGSFTSIISKSGNYSLQFNGPQLEFLIYIGGVKKRLQALSGAVVTGNTYHVVGTYDGVTQKLYVNGSLIVSKPLTGSIGTSTTNLLIGSWDSGSEVFKGIIDEVAIYNTALSSTQVQQHFTSATTF